MNHTERIAGCVLGLALGDAFGAPYEGGLLERIVWRLIGRTGGRRRWTDDTRMTLDIAEALLEDGRIEPDRLAARFARSMRWSRGYGPGAARTLKAIRRGVPWARASRLVYADGSLGNGAAMRSPILGVLYAADREALDAWVDRTARITHAHPEGVDGALLIGRWIADIARGAHPHPALAGRRADGEPPFVEQIERADGWLSSAARPDPAEVAKALGNGITARASCVSAMYCAARFADATFDELLDFIRRMGGDVDTIGAMAGAGWGTYRGRSALPDAALAALEAREVLDDVAARLGAIERAG